MVEIIHQHQPVPTFLRPPDPRKEIINLIKYELCRLDVMLNAGKFADCPDLYQDVFCFWNQQLKIYGGE